MTFLVTGGTGFIGSYVVRRLVQEGERVLSFDRSPHQDVMRLFPAGVEVMAGDVGDRRQVAAAFQKHPHIDRVVHLAYMMGAESEADPVSAMRVNALGPANLFAEAGAHGVKRIVFASSISLYGKSQAVYGDRPVTEDDFCAPQDQAFNYSLTKLLNEHLAAKYEARYGIPIVSLRVPVVLGHGRKHGTTTWASDFASLPAQGRPVTLPFPEHDQSCCIYVADLAEQIHALAVKPSLAHRIYNSGGHTATARELAALVRTVLPDAQISFRPDKPPSPFISRLDDQRIRQELGCALRPLRQAIIEHIEEARRREALAAN